MSEPGSKSSVARVRLEPDARAQTGPFDIIGDVHGCADELEALLVRLGYGVTWSTDAVTAERRVAVVAPAGRRAIFLGDLVDRGPRSTDVLRLVMTMVEAKQAFCVIGNHDAKLLRWLEGRNIKIAHGLAATVAQMAGESAAFRERARTFIDGLPAHLWLDGGRLVVAHAGIREAMIGRTAGGVREFCLYGDTSGEIDAFGLPVRRDWAAAYGGTAAIVYGHVPAPEAAWRNNTICIDTGCCFGGSLTALRWPEKDLVDVPAARVYATAIRPLGHRMPGALDTG